MYFSIGALFLLMGLAVERLHWYFLISGYNTMSREKKKNVDVEGLWRLLGYYMYGSALLFVLLGVLQRLAGGRGMLFTGVLWGLGTLGILVTAQQFDHNPRATGWRLVRGIIGVTLLFGVVLFFLFSTGRPAELTVTDESLTIHGMYGDTWENGEIRDLSLLEEMPVLTGRTNGSSFLGQLKGYFRLEDDSKVLVFITRGSSPYIRMETPDGVVYMNRPDSQETRLLYENMKNFLPGA